MAGRILTVGLLLLLLGLAGYAAWTGWQAASEAEIGFHGVVALLLGAFFTLALTGLLVWLMRLSHRRGYDQ
jgi:hypothetical protein